MGIRNPLAFRVGASLSTFIGLCSLAYFSTLGAGTENWYSVVPPLIAVILAFLFRNVIFGLGAGVVVGAFLTKVPEAPWNIENWKLGAQKITTILWATITDAANLRVLVYVCLVLAMVRIMMASGGLQGIASWLRQLAASRRSTMVTTMLLGLAVFIDDYANAMVVGSTMQPLTDRYQISREKLAYIVDSTSAPIAGLVILSTWVGYEVGLIEEVGKSLGIASSGYSILIEALPYRFYCLGTLIFLSFVVLTGIDFGPMRAAEARARKIQNSQVSEEGKLKLRTGRASLAVAPLLMLFTVFICAIWEGGGGTQLGWKGLVSFAGWKRVLANADSIKALCWASLVGVSFAMLLSYFVAQQKPKQILYAFWEGIRASSTCLLIFFLAWALKAVCDDLETGKFIAITLSGIVSPIWFPSLVFLSGAAVSFTTGTSWGTMAILIPTTLPVAVQLDGGVFGLVSILSVSAVLDGSIFGDHCSPLSDTSIISATSSGCDLLAHVRTQVPYSVIVAFAGICLGYVPAAMGSSWGLSAALCVSFFGVILFAMAKRKQFSSLEPALS